jgi:hypothetical protein
VLTVGDASLALSLNGGTTPFLAFDANDYLQYNRTSNVYAFNVGGATKATIDSGGNLSATGSIFPSGDANYLLGISSGAPTITFDSGDSIQFNRTTNTFAFTVGGSGKAFVSAGGIEASALVSDSYVAAATYVQAGDVNFGINFNGGTPILQFDAGDYMQYNRAANSFSFNIGNVAKAIIDSAGNFSNSGSIQPSGDASYLLQMNGGNPLIIFDTNDLIRYDRAANKFYFVIGGVNVASIDASGNMRIKGTLAQGVTP